MAAHFTDSCLAARWDNRWWLGRREPATRPFRQSVKQHWCTVLERGSVLQGLVELKQWISDGMETDELSIMWDRMEAAEVEASRSSKQVAAKQDAKAWKLERGRGFRILKSERTRKDCWVAKRCRKGMSDPKIQVSCSWNGKTKCFGMGWWIVRESSYMQAGLSYEWVLPRSIDKQRSWERREIQRKHVGMMAAQACPHACLI